MTFDTDDSCSVNFGGLRFRGIRKKQLFPEEGKFKFIVTANADFIVHSWSDQRFRRIISENYSTFDGQITWWLARLLSKPFGRKIEKISGSSFAHDLLQFAGDHKRRVFFLGSEQEVNDAAATVARNLYDVQLLGYSPEYARYPLNETWNNDVMDRIRAFRPHILFVALGSPKQEYWIDDNREALRQLGVQLAIGCGGTLDFLAGKIRRAPVFLQQAGLEGVYRLFVQPSGFRLKRLIRSLLVFPIAAFRYFRPLSSL